MDEQQKKMDMLSKLAALQAGATGQRPILPGEVAGPGPDSRMTAQDEDRMRATQLMQLANSPTRGMVAPNAQQLQAQDLEAQSMLNELGEGVEVPEKPKRFQKIFSK